MNVLDVVAKEVSTICAVPPSRIRPDAMLIEYGLDSVRGMDLFISLETRFDLELRDDAIADVRTVSDVCRLIEHALKLAR